MTKRNLLRIAVLLAAVAYFAYANYLKPHPANGVVAAHTTTAAAIPANAREFTLGTLAFKSCELAQKRTGATTAAFCAPFSVAERRDENQRDKPAGRKIDLKVALIKSHAPALVLSV